MTINTETVAPQVYITKSPANVGEQIVTYWKESRSEWVCTIQRGTGIVGTLTGGNRLDAMAILDTVYGDEFAVAVKRSVTDAASAQARHDLDQISLDLPQPVAHPTRARVQSARDRWAAASQENQ